MRIGWEENKVLTACKFSFLALYKACNSAFLFDVAITVKEKTSAPFVRLTEIGGRRKVPNFFIFLQRVLKPNNGHGRGG
jgi:hypothetical protein